VRRPDRAVVRAQQAKTHKNGYKSIEDGLESRRQALDSYRRDGIFRL
jgi:hypothetical protein